MGRIIEKLSDTEVIAIRERVIKARKEQEKRRDVIKKCSNAYNREMLGFEKEKRSRVTASTVHNHVHGIHPNMMKRYLATDHRISVVGPDPLVAKALKVWVRERLTDQGSFRLMNDVILDGLIYSNGTAKVYWQRLWGKPLSGEKVMTEEQMLVLADDPEWTFQSVEPLPRRKAQLIDSDLHVDPVTGADLMEPKVYEVEGKQMYRCRCTHTKLLESNPVCVPIPPEEFIAERGKVRMNDRKACGHIRASGMMGGELMRENERLSLNGKPFYKGLKRALLSPDMLKLTDEKDVREAREAPLWDYGYAETDDLSPEDLRREGVPLEWSDYVVEGGKLVPAIITFINSEIVRVEENEEGIVGMMTWSPMVLTHSIFGLGVGWLHADEQNVQTILTRAILDSVAFSIDKPRMIRNKSANLMELQDLYPGKLVVGNEGDFKDIDVGVIDFRILQAIEFLKSEGEERGPATRYNMGTDSDTLNGTATGISLIQRASLNKVDMIALAFGELFLVDAYNKHIFLAQKNLDIPATVIVDGEKVVLTKEKIQGDYRARGDLGLDVDFDDRQFAKATQLLQINSDVGKTFPPLFTIEAGREHLRRIYIAAGEKDMSQILPPIPEYLKGWFPGKEQMEMAAAAKAQMEQQASAAGSVPTSPGGAGAVPAENGMPPQLGSGIPDAEPQGRDYASGQGSSQPDESMMEI